MTWVRAADFGEVCRVVVGELPRTGASIAPGQLVMWALVLVLAGAVGVALVRRRPGAGVTAAAVVLLAGAPVPDASAAEAEVSYGEGCGLLEVVDAELSDDLVDGLLPGDRVVAVKATVVNRFEQPVEVRLAGEVSDGWVDVVTATPRFVDASAGAVDDPVTVRSGGRQDVELVVELPHELGDDAQAADGAVELVITSAQQAP